MYILFYVIILVRKLMNKKYQYFKTNKICVNLKLKKVKKKSKNNITNQIFFYWQKIKVIM